MAKKFDSTVKNMVAADPIANAGFCCQLINLPCDEIEIIGTTVTKVTDADTAYKVRAGADWFVLHVEYQTSHELILPRRVWHYNTGIDQRDDLPVYSVVVLLRPAANASSLTGTFQRGLPGRRPSNQFWYDVIRVWTLPLDLFLEGPASLLPFALLTDEAATNLPRACEQVVEVVKDKVPGTAARRELMTRMFFLGGARYNELLLEPLTRRADMEISSTYQATVKKGEERGIKIGEERGLKIGEERGLKIGEERGLKKGEVRGQYLEGLKILIQLGTKRFGKPSAKNLKQIKQITDPEQLEALCLKVLTATSWDDLLTSE